MTNMRQLTLALALAGTLAVGMVPSVLAGQTSDQAQKEATGWGCAAAVGLPAGHCISPGTVERWPDLLSTKNGTFQLLVFDESGNFVTAEIATVKTSADDRPCPHDAESLDGTYWDFVADFLWVCHHRSE